MIRVLWYHDRSFLDRVIQVVSRSPYNHVAIQVDGVVYESAAHGVVVYALGAASAVAERAAMTADVDLVPDDARRLRKFLDHEIGHAYSVTGLICAGLALATGYRLIVARDGEFICSGLVASALAAAGWEFDTDPRLQTPASLALDPRFRPQTR